MGTTISGIRLQLDPCKQYQHCELKDMVIAMGKLPSCIDLNNPKSLIHQVVAVCNIVDPRNHLFLPEVDKDGTWLYFDFKVLDRDTRLTKTNYELRHAIGVMSRNVGGDYEAIYFYADGTIVVIGKWDNHIFHMDG